MASQSLLLFQLKFRNANLALSSSGGVGVLNAQPGRLPVLAPVDGQLDEFVTATGVTSSAGRHGYSFAFTGGLVLDVSSSSTAIGTPVQLWSVNHGENQLWTFWPTGDGNSYYIMNMRSSLVLDDPNNLAQIGQTVQQWSMNDSGAQYWSFIAPNPAITPVLNATLRYEGGAGEGWPIAITGSNFEASSAFSIWVMNMPFHAQNQAFQITPALYKQFSTQIFPDATHAYSDANGTMNFSLIAPLLWKAHVSTTPQPLGRCVLVLENASGGVAAMAVLSQAAFTQI